MYPPIFEAVNVPAVRALLKNGNGPLRFYLFGMAPQNVKKPYAVWQMSGGSPENYLGGRPDVDSISVQVDVYADGPSSARNTAMAIRDAIEESCHITSWIGESIDPDTKNCRYTFICDWWVDR